MEFNKTIPTYFQDKSLPSNTKLVGWSALVYGLSIAAPVRKLSCVSKGYIAGSKRQEGKWLVFDKRYKPKDTPMSHIAFALKHEDIDLLILKRAFEKIPQADIEEFIKATPTGAIARKIWFFYEFLLKKKLNIPDIKASAAKYIELLDSKKYFTTGVTEFSRRHHIKNNLLGVYGFCPIVRRTEKLQKFVNLDLASQARNIVGKTGKHLISRAASLMLLADSRASFAIEGEKPARSRLERWGKVLSQAGKRLFDKKELYRLHGILLGDSRFTKIGYRDDGVFLGERDHNQDPIPEFIGAKPEDIPFLMQQLELLDSLGTLLETVYAPVIQAAIVAFGFVYIHPLEDGNGRLHRYLIHHVLAQRKFSPEAMVFPVSSVMLDRIEEYKQVLQNHSAPLMPFIEWEPTKDHNVNVVNDTKDLYSYFDATEVAEFLYECVQITIERDLPREISYLSANDEAKRNIMEYMEMPDNMVESLIIFIRQNNGKLPQKRRKKEFSALTEQEVKNIENIVRKAFENHDNSEF